MVAILNAKNVEDTKSFMSRQKDTYKTPYDKHPKDHKRQCVFAGSSNSLDFLPMDRSGNRRFLPIQCNVNEAEVHILDDEKVSREYIAQMWAEAMEIYRSGISIILIFPTFFRDRYSSDNESNGIFEKKNKSRKVTINDKV